MLYLLLSCKSSSKEVLNTSSNSKTPLEQQESESVDEQENETEPASEPSSCFEELDQDGDGQSVEEGDCNDNDPNIFEGAEETYYDGVDSNCDEANDYDQDGDGIVGFDEQGNIVDCDDQNINLQSCCVLTECVHSILLQEGEVIIKNNGKSTYFYKGTKQDETRQSTLTFNTTQYL